MLCKIADLLTEIPDVGDMPERCREYLCSLDAQPTVVISEDKFDPSLWPDLSYDKMAYMETGGQFFYHLLNNDGMMLHASAVAMEGKAYLFSGQCGMGKSTHTRLWQSTFGEKAQVFNDDKPPLRLIDGVWYAYGAPWCGKDGINQNVKVPLAGICFLQQAQENQIRRLSQKEALPRIISQTVNRFRYLENLDKMVAAVEKLVTKIPVFLLENRPEPEAAQLSYQTMCKAAQEENL